MVTHSQFLLFVVDVSSSCCTLSLIPSVITEMDVSELPNSLKISQCMEMIYHSSSTSFPN